MKIGFIGLGIMGLPMAKNLLAKEQTLLVNDLDTAAVEAAVAAGGVAATCAEIGRECELVCTILPNGSIVQEVLFGEGGVCTAPKAVKTVVDMSSVTPGDSHICADRLAALGIDFIDAPVSGGEPKAIDGTLSFMVGGDEAVFARVEPVLLLMGASAVRIGGTGTGSVAKLANQVIVNLTIAAVSEGLVLATKAGADPQRVYQAIRGGLAGSTVLDAKAPMMIARDFKPGGKISINHKDIKNVLACAHEIDAPLPLSANLFEILQSLKVSGHMDDDHAGIVQFYEQLAGIEVKRPEVQT